MIVAFVVPHNEGIVRGVVAGLGFDIGTHLTDLYEVDASITSHASLDEAQAWLEQEFEHDDLPFARTNVRGGYIETTEF